VQSLLTRFEAERSSLIANNQSKWREFGWISHTVCVNRPRWWRGWLNLLMAPFIHRILRTGGFVESKWRLWCWCHHGSGSDKDVQFKLWVLCPAYSCRFSSADFLHHFNIQNYCTYLHVAARYGLTEVVAGMLETGINVNGKDKVTMVHGRILSIRSLIVY
jgi:hypothetical protein